MQPEYSLAIVRVFVRDLERSLGFYRDTLGMRVAFASEAWAQLDTGAAQLALERAAAGDHEAAELVGRFVGVSLAVPDVNAAFGELSRRGVAFVAEPERMAWGGTLAHFRDPDGNVLTLLESPRAGAP